MKDSIKTGFSFGLTSGIITTLGLMVGLHSGTHSELAVLGGILTIAVADAFSDALGVHISEESKNNNTPRQVWEATISTMLTKFIFAMTFAVPVILLELRTAMIVSVVWGLAGLSVLSYWISRGQEEKPWRVVIEHLVIAGAVILATHFIGDMISNTLGQHGA